MANCIIRHIPNAITCCNLLSGCMAVISALNGDSQTAFLWIAAGAVADFLDGMSARILKCYSSIGKELDSLSDLVTFGVAPAMLCLKMLGNVEWPFAQGFIPYLGLVIAVASALRLAKFNTDTRQTSSFLGLAVPADALFWCGIVQNGSFFAERQWAAWGLIAAIFLFAWLMLSEIPMFSLKFRDLSWRDNWLRYVFLAISLVLLVTLGYVGMSAVIVWYILLSLIFFKKKDVA
ncbi:MAG: CDP-diacylglycerol--serine O-phosphatidyltransferase [Bacteroidaceae bacterium]|nr:CDP-diacylglycerol--serine O-phosphatidyltransferase [Bacteroidaceae bacterium]